MYKIRKWCKMLFGNSIYHVVQGEGGCYSRDDIKGYYNDLTEKVLRDDKDILVPKYDINGGGERYFSIGVFQYGLAAWDLYLKTGADEYREKTFACAEWAIDNQQKNGGWITFNHKNIEHSYSSMAQGEAISLLVRCYRETGDLKYLTAAEKAEKFMILPISEGGTASYENGGLTFYESTEDPLILNGWIFSLWGIFDYFKCTGDVAAGEILDKTLSTLRNRLPEFDCGYWSKYDTGKRISSEFYHKLHIAQLKTMYDLFGDDIYRQYSERWQKFALSRVKKTRAFIVKAIQKVRE